MAEYRSGEWRVLVSEDNDFRQENWEVTFRRAIHLSMKCEEFSLMIEEKEETLLTLYLFDNGAFSAEVYSPSLIRRKGDGEKSMWIGVFDRSSWDFVP